MTEKKYFMTIKRAGAPPLQGVVQRSKEHADKLAKRYGWGMVEVAEDESGQKKVT